MRRMWAAGAAIVMCLALGGVPGVAQSPAVPEGPVAVQDTLTRSMSKNFTVTIEGDVQHLRDGGLACSVTASDPRLDGVRQTLHADCDCTDAGGCACWGPWEGTGASGGWTGYFVSAEPYGLTPGTVMVAQGTGGYAGLTWVENHVPTGDMVYGGNGMVYQGPPPPWAPLPSTAP